MTRVFFLPECSVRKCGRSDESLTRKLSKSIDLWIPAIALSNPQRKGLRNFRQRRLTLKRENSVAISINVTTFHCLGHSLLQIGRNSLSSWSQDLDLRYRCRHRDSIAGRLDVCIKNIFSRIEINSWKKKVKWHLKVTMCWQ